MATLRTAIQLTDGMTPGLRSITYALNIVISSFEAMQQASSNSIDTSSIQTARQELAKAEVAFNEIEQGINKAAQQQQNYTNKVNQSQTAVYSLSKKVDEVANSDIIDTSGVKATVQELKKAETTFERIEQNVKDSTIQQSNFNNKINQGKIAAGGLSEKIGGYVKAFLGMAALKGGMNLTDTYINNDAKLTLINDGLQTQAELQDKIFAAAQRSRGAYSDMVGTVGKLGLLAKDAFNGNNDETIAFAELMQKSFRISGASTQEQQSGMYQLTQAMASGRLQGDEFRSIIENAPMLAQAIAKYTGKSMGELKEMSTEGDITANIIKASLFSVSKEINEMADKMPKTFGDIWKDISSQATKEFSNVMTQINDFINMDTGKSIVNGIAVSINSLAQGVSILFNILIPVTTLFVDNWSIIAPIIMIIVGAIMAYNLALGIYNTIGVISTGIEIASAIAKGIHTKATVAEIAATKLATGAQVGLNAAMLASPITWVILAIVALIAIIYGAVAMINKFAGTSISATGLVAGAFTSAAAVIWNLVLGVLELVLGVINFLVNPFINFANFLGNLFTSPISSIIYAFQGLGDVVLGILQTIASTIDAVFGSKLSEGVSKWRGGLKDMADNAVKKYAPEENYQKVIENIDFNIDNLGLKRVDYADAQKKGYQWGQKLDDKIKSMSISDMLNMPTGTDSLFNNVGQIANNTGSIKDSLDVTEEDLKYLRDAAEMEVINRFTTAEIKVDLGGVTNNVASNTDLDGMVSYLEDSIYEAMSTAAEGVHDV